MTPPTTPPAGLDFASIRQQYPAAFAALNLWAESLLWRLSATLLHVDQYVFSVPDNPRDLYDFFDQAGVYPHVRLPHDENGNWYAFVMVGRALHYLSESIYPTRTAAESAAFMAAFGKLEEVLTTQTNVRNFGDK